jgi:hypothetical protein
MMVLDWCCLLLILLPCRLQLIKELSFFVRYCTPREALHLGIFLGDLQAVIEKWRVSRCARGGLGVEGGHALGVSQVSAASIGGGFRAP